MHHLHLILRLFLISPSPQKIRIFVSEIYTIKMQVSACFPATTGAIVITGLPFGRSLSIAGASEHCWWFKMVRILLTKKSIWQLSQMLLVIAGLEGFEPSKWRSQSPLPYRLAIALYVCKRLRAGYKAELYSKVWDLTIPFCKNFAPKIISDYFYETSVICAVFREPPSSLRFAQRTGILLLTG